ncbi:MAG: GntR family transcriptional regulator [Burkholderiales bacterium]|nr:GntR family transcriptional regulator [Burkholderiales bacterium]
MSGTRPGDSALAMLRERGRAGGSQRVRAHPRYRVIAECLLAEIANGKHAVGNLLPTEIELCKRFGASRYTVREALRVITEKGLVTRRPGAGSMVIAAAQPSVYRQTLNSLSEILSYPSETYRDGSTSASVVADGQLATLLGCPLGAGWFRISGVRRSAGIPLPLAWQDIYILPRLAGVVRSPNLDREPVYAQLERMFGQTAEYARLELFPSRVSRKIAPALAVKVGSPAITIIRRYIDKDACNFETTVTIHPEGRFTYSMEFRRELHAPR